MVVRPIGTFWWEQCSQLVAKDLKSLVLTLESGQNSVGCLELPFLVSIRAPTRCQEVGVPVLRSKETRKIPRKSSKE